jgi:glycosyltransferase involved in cell wall biosynthesis
LYVGILEPRKNLVRLIHAFERYRAAGGDAALVIAGRIGWKAAEIERAARDSSVSTDIYMIGYVDDAHLPALISGAHAFTFPSLYEGFGAPPVEALMFDVPVLAANASCLPEILGDAAMYVDPLNEEDIATGLRQIDTDTQLRERLIHAGKTQRSLYSADNTAKGILRLYDLSAL